MIDKETFNNITAMYHTFGCKLNFSETSTVARMFAERGIRRVDPGEKPDVIVVNTCSVTELADKKCRQSVRALHRRYPDASILLTGCYAQLKPGEASDLPGVTVVAGNDAKLRLGEFLDEFIRTHEKQVSVKATSAELRTFEPSCSRGDRTRYFLKVQDGCDNWCTYCTIPRARGRSRSGSIESMVDQAKRAAEEGGKEIVITGVNIGDFGKGRDDNFFDLIRRLDEVEGIERYRISSIEPDLLSDEMIEWLARSRSFMPHFHIPLQNGSDAMLRIMHRHYDTALFRHKIEAIRAAMPDAFIGIDLIAGMRGETPQLFEESMSFIDSLDISRLHVFTYSERPGTKALEITPAVSPADKHERTRRMLDLSQRKLTAFASRFAGTAREVLLEHPHEGKLMGGFTDNYLRVAVDAPVSLDNTIVKVRLGKFDASTETFSAELV